MRAGSGLAGFRFPELKKADLASVLIIFIYCVSYAALRLLVSPSMELDEAEQFLNGASFHLGYAHQAPLYTWIVWLVSLLSGRGLDMIVLIKYGLLFVFYISFYLLARHFLVPGKSLMATGCLLLFPIYSYEANRDLSNTVLVSAMAVIAGLFFLRLLLGGSRLDYLLFGASCGLGMLSKYNFVLFLLALLMYGITSAHGRRIMSDKKIFFSLAAFSGVVLPHAAWLAGNGFPSVQYAYNLSLPWVPKPHSFLHFLAAVYGEVILFLVVFVLFMGRYFYFLSFRGLFVAKKGGVKKEARPSPAGVFPALALYGLAIPLLGIIIFDPAHFQDRWLAPAYFALPLAGFSLLSTQKMPRVRCLSLGYLCLAIAAIVFAARAVIGFFPDVTGKTERIHIPYASLARQLGAGARKAGIDGLRGLPIIARAADSYIAANIIADMPGTRYVPLREALRRPEILDGGGIFISTPGNGSPPGLMALFPETKKETVSSSYLHTHPHSRGLAYMLDALIILPEKTSGGSPEKTSGGGKTMEAQREANAVRPHTNPERAK